MFIKKNVLLSTFAFFSLFSGSICSYSRNDIQGSGKVIHEERKLKKIERIEATGNCFVVVSKGKASKVTVSAEDNIMRSVKTRVVGNTLYLGLIEKQFSKRARPTKPLRFDVVTDDLVLIRVSGNCRFVMRSSFASRRFDVRGSGSSKLEVKADTKDFEAKLSGASDLSVTGSATKSFYFLSGSSIVNALSFPTDYVKIEFSGATRSDVWANKGLQVRGSGVGKVRYKGEPSVSSTVTPMNSVVPY